MKCAEHFGTPSVPRRAGASSASVLGLRFRSQYRSTEVIPCTYRGRPHAYCAVASWGLDPTGDQFDPRAPLVFNVSISNPYLRFDQAAVPPLCEVDLICLLARRWRLGGAQRDAVASLLKAGDESYLLRPIERAAEGVGIPSERCFCGREQIATWKSMECRTPICRVHAAELR